MNDLLRASANDSVGSPAAVMTEEAVGSAGEPTESFADALRRSFMNISITSQTSTISGSTSPGGLQENSHLLRDEQKQESLDAWIMDDQSEGASIITLDTVNDSDDMDDFDDFKDIEQELSMWISKH